MSDTIIIVENLSKLYRLGEVGTETPSHDLNRLFVSVVYSCICVCVYVCTFEYLKFLVKNRYAYFLFWKAWCLETFYWISKENIYKCCVFVPARRRRVFVDLVRHEACVHINVNKIPMKMKVLHSPICRSGWSDTEVRGGNEPCWVRWIRSCKLPQSSLVTLMVLASLSNVLKPATMLGYNGDKNSKGHPG